MANTNNPTGARLTQSAYNSRINSYVVPATDGTALFVGDFVKSGGSSEAATGLPTVIQAAAGDVLRGVVVGIEPDNTSLSLSLELNYRPASVRRVVRVCDDPNAVFEIQEDSGGACTALVDVGENADIVVGSGDTASGKSAMQLDSSTHVTTSAQLRILGFVASPNNTPASNYAKLLVKINKHELASTTGV